MIPTTSSSGPAITAYKHLQVREYLERLIADELQVGDLIPSERFLTQRFGISRMTVRQAIDGLVSEGTLRREHGRGTFVADRMHSEFELRLTTFGEEMRHRGLEPGALVLLAEDIEAESWLVDTFGVEPGARLHHFERLRTADGFPFSIEESWIPVDVAPALLDDGVPDSLYAALRAANLPPTWGEDAIAAGLASDREAALLDVTLPHAVLRTRRVTFSGDVPVMYAQSCTRGDRHTLVVPLREPRPTLVPRERRRDSASAGRG
ncbi:GntR family transcriptional regulator [Xylanimonas ulmi]|uniref:GntR family transcriptional regulator n=1 Tax=Xylanimonas ulmi TaxID=228973 RepID=A0A4Q7M2F8_9MICO|nr:GntR family transcriptional regulator [Xylanibacterium ulmi]RZS62066.1 GntR family transcriptional regulator [Xylanibacterium ulmi]